MGIGRIFIHDPDKIVGGLMVLFFGLVFSVASVRYFCCFFNDTIVLLHKVRAGFYVAQ